MSLLEEVFAADEGLIECERCGSPVLSQTSEPRMCQVCGMINSGYGRIWVHDPNDTGHP